MRIVCAGLILDEFMIGIYAVSVTSGGSADEDDCHPRGALHGRPYGARAGRLPGSICHTK